MYVIDPAFLEIISFHFSEDIGRVIENMVFIALKQKGKEIYFHKEEHECDFLIRRGKDIVSAVQVTWELNRTSAQREIDGLLEAMKRYHLKEGLILTYEQEEERKVGSKKIHILPIWKWLLQS